MRAWLRAAVDMTVLMAFGEIKEDILLIDGDARSLIGDEEEAVGNRAVVVIRKKELCGRAAQIYTWEG